MKAPSARLIACVGVVISFAASIAFAKGMMSNGQNDAFAFIPSNLTTELKLVSVKELIPECTPVSVWTRVEAIKTIDKDGRPTFAVGCRDANNKPSVHYVDPITGDEIPAEAATYKTHRSPPPEVSAGLKIPNNFVIGTTDDKRFLVYAITPSGIDSMAVVDTQSNKMIWRRKYEGSYPTPYDEFFGLLRRTRNTLEAFVDRGDECSDQGRCQKHSLVRIQIPSGVESAVKLDDDVFTHMSPYGTDEVIYLLGRTGPDTVRDNARATIVSLKEMKVTWTGEWSNAPSPSNGIYCATPVNKEEFKLPFDIMALNAMSWNRDIFISVNGRSGRLTSVQPGAACEVSADGKSVIVAIPPKVAVYKLR